MQHGAFNFNQIRLKKRQHVLFLLKIRFRFPQKATGSTRDRVPIEARNLPNNSRDPSTRSRYPFCVSRDLATTRCRSVDNANRVGHGV